jgi:hypothetical protein
MEDNEIRHIMQLIHALSPEDKLETMSRLASELRADLPAIVEKPNKNDLIDQLYGS